MIRLLLAALVTDLDVCDPYSQLDPDVLLGSDTIGIADVPSCLP